MKTIEFIGRLIVIIIAIKIVAWLLFDIGILNIVWSLVLMLILAMIVFSPILLMLLLLGK